MKTPMSNISVELLGEMIPSEGAVGPKASRAQPYTNINDGKELMNTNAKAPLRKLNLNGN